MNDSVFFRFFHKIVSVRPLISRFSFEDLAERLDCQVCSGEGRVLVLPTAPSLDPPPVGEEDVQLFVLLFPDLESVEVVHSVTAEVDIYFVHEDVVVLVDGVRDCGSVRVFLNDSTVPANIYNIFQKAVENGRYYTELDGAKIFNLYSRDGDSILFMLHSCAAISR